MSVLHDIHQIVNEGTKPLTPEMKKKVKERAFELADMHTDVDEDKVAKILTRMAMSGDDLDDLEALEGELKMTGGTSSHSERSPNKYKNMSLQQLKMEKAKLEQGFKDSVRGGMEYDTLESQIRSLDMLIKKAKK